MPKPPPHQIRVLLASNLKRLRASRGWKQPDLADAAGVSEGTIANIERFESFAGSDVLTRLAEALEVDPSELFRNPSIEKKFEPSSELRAALAVLNRELGTSPSAAEAPGVIPTFDFAELLRSSNATKVPRKAKPNIEAILSELPKELQTAIIIGLGDMLEKWLASRRNKLQSNRSA